MYEQQTVYARISATATRWQPACRRHHGDALPHCNLEASGAQDYGGRCKGIRKSNWMRMQPSMATRRAPCTAACCANWPTPPSEPHTRPRSRRVKPSPASTSGQLFPAHVAIRADRYRTTAPAREILTHSECEIIRDDGKPVALATSTVMTLQGMLRTDGDVLYALDASPASRASEPCNEKRGPSKLKKIMIMTGGQTRNWRSDRSACRRARPCHVGELPGRSLAGRNHTEFLTPVSE